MWTDILGGYRRMANTWAAKSLPLIGDSRGSLLLEVVVATGVFAMVGTAVLSGLSTMHTAGARTETQSIAENIARNQMESVFDQPYLEPNLGTYPAIAVPAGYGSSATPQEITPGDPDIQKIVVKVQRGGQDVLVLEGLRAKN